MKRSYLFGLGIIAVAVIVIVSAIGDASSYVTFSQAEAMAAAGKNKQIHVVGELKKNERGEPVGIETSADKLSFRFIMVDEEGREQTVYYNEPIPADFKRSEQVVIIGGFHDELFLADKILMKCPSKYQEDEIKV
ncbi:MAG: cytochrome c maturation protein CcmE [Cyclobacteriaceae bacterium]|nr:cytochrome c maturation protein CcmE [Cyclobacteriaceae bacterium]MCH8514938.1 cytochrome c maturation protein CcmE [Cyclobacteriaceae bacterium]